MPYPVYATVHIILSSKRSLPRRLVFKCAAMPHCSVCLPPLLLAAFIGNRLAVYGGAADSDAYVAKWRVELAQQGREIAAAKRKTGAGRRRARTAGWNAACGVIRLDALRCAPGADGRSRSRGVRFLRSRRRSAAAGPTRGSALRATGLQSTPDALATLAQRPVTTARRARALPADPKAGESRRTAWRARRHRVDLLVLRDARSDPLRAHGASHGHRFPRAAWLAGQSRCADGVVSWSGPRNGYGQHGRGQPRQLGLTTRYGHNSKNLVAVGDTVTRAKSSPSSARRARHGLAPALPRSCRTAVRRTDGLHPQLGVAQLS